MAVIINDFEVVPQSPSEPPAPEAEGQQPAPQRLTPRDIEAIRRRDAQRTHRLRAH